MPDKQQPAQQQEEIFDIMVEFSNEKDILIKGDMPEKFSFSLDNFLLAAQSIHRKLRERPLPFLRWVRADKVDLDDITRSVIAKRTDDEFIKGRGQFQKSNGTFFWVEHGFVPVLKKDHDKLLLLEERPPIVPEAHVHVNLPSGALATVSPNASPELLASLDKMVELAKRMPEVPKETLLLQGIEKKGDNEDILWNEIQELVDRNTLHGYLPDATIDILKGGYTISRK